MGRVPVRIFLSKKIFRTRAGACQTHKIQVKQRILDLELPRLGWWLGRPVCHERGRGAMLGELVKEVLSDNFVAGPPPLWYRAIFNAWLAYLTSGAIACGADAAGASAMTFIRAKSQRTLVPHLGQGWCHN
jgi:hypothetical protein